MRDAIRYSEDSSIQTSLAERYAELGEHTGCYRRECYVCGKIFYAGMPHAELCSERCNQKATLWRRWAERVIERQRVCLTCGKDFLGSRKDAQYCTAACRQRAYRKRVTVEVTAERPE